MLAVVYVIKIKLKKMRKPRSEKVKENMRGIPKSEEHKKLLSKLAKEHYVKRYS